ncbi:MAG: glycosyltransferase family 2 protein [Planctomycetota bacterium]
MVDTEIFQAPAATTGADELPEAVRRQVYVVLAAYHETACIEDVVRGLVALYPNVVVVDDGSQDATGALALRAGATVLRHVLNRGQGAALQTGIRFALARGAQYVVTFDSDGQHLADDIARLVGPVHRGEVDITLGSRFLGQAVNMTAGRRWLLRAGVLFTRIVSGVKVTDTHNGLRCFSRRAAECLHITLDRMAHASELIDQVRVSGLPYREVPVHILYTEYSRAKGQGALGALTIVLHYFLGRLT